MVRWGVMAAALLAACAFAAPAPAAEVDAGDKLDEVLKRPIYNRWRLRQDRARSSGGLKIDQSYFQSLGDVLDRWVTAIVDWIFPNRGSGYSRPKLGWRGGVLSRLSWFLKYLGIVLLAVMALISLGMLVAALLRHRSRRRAAHVLSRQQVREALEAGEALAMDIPQWLKEADRLASEGDRRAVFRALYLALLSGLHAAGKINFRSNRTNWTYVRHFRGADADRETFGSLTTMFDRVWYGLHAGELSSPEEVKRRMASLLPGEASRA